MEGNGRTRKSREAWKTGMGARGGVLLALGVTLFTIGLIAYVASRTPPSEADARSVNSNPGEAPPNPFGDDVEAAAVGGFRGSSSARYQFQDRRDPGRIAGEFEHAGLEPLPSGLFDVTSPVAWIYLRDGSTLHVRAEEGRIRMPPGDEARHPESGRFAGRVEIRYFEPPGEDAPLRPIDPLTDTPRLLAVTDSLSFDTLLGELSTPDPLVISTLDLELRGTGLLVRMNQVEERLEHLRINKGRSIRYAPAPRTARSSPSGPEEPSQPRAVQDQPSASPSTPQPPPPSPIVDALLSETLYRAVFQNVEVIRTEERRIFGDTLTLWARLIDNKLPDGALGAPDARAAAPQSAAPPVSDTRADHLVSPPTRAAIQTVSFVDAPASRPHAETVPVLTRSGPDDVTLIWSGPLIVTPIADTPTQLADGNHAALRMEDRASGRVRFEDDPSSAEGSLTMLEYIATHRVAALLGGEEGATVTAAAGTFSGPEIFADLSRGSVRIPGAGHLAQHDVQARESARIDWFTEAAFDLAVERGFITDRLLTADFAGNVVARDRRASIAAEALTARFFDGDPRHANVIRRLDARGPVTLLAEADTVPPPRAPYSAGLSPTTDLGPGFLIADNLTVDFIPVASGSTDARPTRLFARGGAVAGQRDRVLISDQFTANFDPTSPARDTQIHTVNAEGSVRYYQTDGVFALADEMQADAPAETATLIGRTVALGAPGARIITTQARLSGKNGLIETMGPGRFEHAETLPLTSLPLADEDLTLTAVWTRAMSFNDSTGEFECHGDVVMTHRPSPLEVRIMRSHRGEATLVPPQASTTRTPASAPDALQGRQLITATAYGRSLEEAGAPDASAEVRRYAASPAGQRRLERLFSLEGPTIHADNTEGVILVDHPGRAVVFDRRDEQSAPPSERGDSLAPGSDTRGSTRFAWDGSMRYARDEDSIRMTGGVEMLHLPLGAREAMRLVCLTLIASIDAGESGSEQDVRLTRAEAIGAVYAESAANRLVADRVVYDAVLGRAEASAFRNNRVTLFDDRRAAPVSAGRILWDLIRDRVEILDPAPAIVPR